MFYWGSIVFRSVCVLCGGGIWVSLYGWFGFWMRKCGRGGNYRDGEVVMVGVFLGFFGLVGLGRFGGDGVVVVEVGLEG